MIILLETLMEDQQIVEVLTIMTKMKRKKVKMKKREMKKREMKTCRCYY